MANLNHKNYREIATILEKYGISGMSAVSIKRFEKNDKLMPPGMIHDNFKNITEDTSGVDWDNGTGKRTVSFEWNGCTYTLEATFEHDWFDFNVAAGLNRIIIENGNGKRLYFTGDGYQECIVFYRDSEWADAFQKETGMVLSEK